MIEVQAIESSARDSRSGLPRSSSGRTPSKIETGRIRTPRRERGLTSGPDPGKGSSARTHLVVLPEGEEARDAPVSARQSRSSGASRPVSPPPQSPAQNGDPHPQVAQQPGPTHLQLGGHGRRRAVLRGAPPAADSARVPARPGEDANERCGGRARFV